MRRYLLILAVSIASVALFARCEENNVTTIPPSPPSPPAADSVRVTLEVPGSTEQGVAVEFVLVVENLHDEHLELIVGSPPWTFDFDVFTGTSGLVWSRLPEFVPLVATQISLQPHERREFRESWPQVDEQGRSVDPGDYLVRGILRTSQGDLVSGERPLTISSRE